MSVKWVAKVTEILEIFDPMAEEAFDDEDFDMLLFLNQYITTVSSAVAALTISAQNLLLETTPVQESVDSNTGVRDQLFQMSTRPSIFYQLSLITIEELNKLCHLTIPVLINNARTTGEAKVKQGRLPKLSLKDRILNAMMYLRGSPSIRKQSFHSNC